MVHPRNLRIAEQHSPVICAFADLPSHVREAVLTYCNENDYVDDDSPVVQDCLYGLANVPVEILTTEIVKRSREFDGDTGHDSWTSYHAWYLSQGHMPDHDISRPLWPVILSQMEEEVLEDGWHRLHDYVRKGVKSIPCLFVIPKPD